MWNFFCLRLVIILLPAQLSTGGKNPGERTSLLNPPNNEQRRELFWYGTSGAEMPFVNIAATADGVSPDKNQNAEDNQKPELNPHSKTRYEKAVSFEKTISPVQPRCGDGVARLRC
jgi:hypothetical protein